jgi:hypothetical protein
MQLFRRKRQLPLRRQGGVKRWTLLEVVCLCLSVAMIAFPVYAEIVAWTFPPPGAAQEVPPPQAPPELPPPPGEPQPPQPPQPQADDETSDDQADDTTNEEPTPASVPENEPDPQQGRATPTFTPSPDETPDDQIPTEPVGETPTTPVGETPTTPTTGETPTTPVGETPTTPTTGETPTTPTTGETPTTPVGETPTTPVGETPTTPVGETPTEPVGETPTTPVAGTPTTGVNPALTISKSASVDTARPGQEVDFTLNVQTTSTDEIQVEVTDNVPTVFRVMGAASPSGSGTCNVSGNNIVCGITVAANRPATLTIRAMVDTNAAQGAVTNTASAAGNGQSSSDSVSVNIAGTAVTTGPTTPGQPTTDPGQPGQPTSDPGQPGQPTTDPGQPGQPTSTQRPDRPDRPNSSDDDDDDDDDDERTAVPTVPPPGQGGTNPTPTLDSVAPSDGIAIPLFPATPTAQPPVAPQAPAPPAPAPQAPAPTRAQAPAPQVQPQQEQVQPQQEAQPSEATTEPNITPTATASAAVVPTPESAIRFRIDSDWGSAFAGQEVFFTIVVGNPADAQALRDVTISSQIARNLEVLAADSSAANDPAIGADNLVTLQLDRIGAGQTVEIVIQTRVRNDVAPDTTIVNQAQLLYAGRDRPLLSNVIPLLVVGDSAGSQAGATPSATPSGQASTAATAATPTVGTAQTATTATASVQPTSGTAQATTTQQAAPTPTPTPLVAGGGTEIAPLPATSTGVPLMGFALFGLTLLVRTMRLHRARGRI